MGNLAKLIGPALSGIVLETLGAGICFMLNALSFVAVIVSLLMMRLPEYIPREQSKKVMEELKEGLSYLRSTPSIRIILLLIALSSLLVIPYANLFPVIAKMTLKGNATTFGYLSSFTGIGAIGGAIMLASLRPQVNRRKILLLVTIIFGFGLILFSQSHSLIYALLFAAVSGFGMMSQATLVNTLLQTESSLEMRGRVISYFAMAYFGMQPLGALLIGGISHNVGTPITIFFQGIVAVIMAVLMIPHFWKSVH